MLLLRCHIPSELPQSNCRTAAYSRTEIIFSFRNHKASTAARCLYFPLTKYTKAQNSHISCHYCTGINSALYSSTIKCRDFIFYVNTKQFCMYMPLVHLQCKYQRRCHLSECHLTKFYQKVRQ